MAVALTLFGLLVPLTFGGTWDAEARHEGVMGSESGDPLGFGLVRGVPEPREAPIARVLIELSSALRDDEVTALVVDHGLEVAGVTTSFMPPSGIEQQGGYRLDPGESLREGLEAYARVLRWNLVYAVSDAESQREHAASSEAAKAYANLVDDLRARLDDLDGGVPVTGVLVAQLGERASSSLRSDPRVADIVTVAPPTQDYVPSR